MTLYGHIQEGQVYPAARRRFFMRGFLPERAFDFASSTRLNVLNVTGFVSVAIACVAGVGFGVWGLGFGVWGWGFRD